MIARDTQHELRLEVGRVGIPFLGRDVVKLAPGQLAIINGGDLGAERQNSL